MSNPLPPSALSQQISFLKKIFLDSACSCHPIQKSKRPTRKFLKVLEEVARRTMDISIAITLLIFSIPLFICVFIAIKIEDGGRIFFKQTRIGYKGRSFTMYKVRTMIPGAERKIEDIRSLNESDGGILFKIKSDPRITICGRFLRKYSIDEIPQLINVLNGDMSIVGPRPALPNEVEYYTPRQRTRLTVKPGLTCFWQIMGRSEIGFEKQMELDLDYIWQRSLVTDWQIIIKTPAVILGAKGAY